MQVLARGSNFEITAQGATVRCSVVNAPDITPEEGARCAALIHDTLSSEVFARHSPYAGLVFDVQLGPAVFGPKTRASLEELFRAAERAGKRVAVRVGDTAIQRLQFSSLCRECAPTQAAVVSTDSEEHAWFDKRAPG